MRKRQVAVLVVTTALSLMVTGCSSRNKITTEPNPVSATATGSGGTVNENSGIDAAIGAVKAAAVPPTTVNLSGNSVLPHTPQAGIKVALLSCKVPSCVPVTSQMRAATDLLGWNLTVVTPDPAAVGEALQQVVNQGFKYVFMISVSADLVRPQLQLAKANGVAVFDTSVPATSVPGFTAQIRGPALGTRVGQLLADQMIVSSRGDANVLFATIPVFPVYAIMGSGVEAEFQAHCARCQLASLPLTTAQLTAGQVPSAIVAYLQGHPDVNYVDLATGDMFPGLTSALEAAGLDKRVKVVGNVAGSLKVELQSLLDGTALAWVTNGGTAAIWTMVNWMAQLSEGISLSALSLQNGDRSDPFLINTKTVASQVMGNLDSSGEWPGPPNFVQQFKTFWRIN